MLKNNSIKTKFLFFTKAKQSASLQYFFFCYLKALKG